MHKGAAEHWRSQLEERSNFILEVVEAEWDKLRPEGVAHTKDNAIALANLYRAKAVLSGELLGDWKIATINGQPAIEQRIELDLFDDGVVLSFQIDRLLTDGKRFAIFDLKTAARLNERWSSGFDMWLQGKLYDAALAKLVGQRPAFVVVEGLQKTPAKLRYKQCPSWDDSQINEALSQFKRVAFEDKRVIQLAMMRMDNRTYIDFDDFSAELRKQVSLIAVSDEVSYNYGDCYSYNTPCPFLTICKRPVSERVDMLSTKFIVTPTEDY